MTWTPPTLPAPSSPASTPSKIASAANGGGTNTALAVDYCLAHPQWRLSLQTHKITGIR